MRAAVICRVPANVILHELEGGRVLMKRRLVLIVVLLAARSPASWAGVINPDISVIGQPFVRWIDDPFDPAHKRAVLDPGEVESVFDAYLNPYARGTFVFALGDEGLEMEEGYFQLLRGLPAGLALKGGKYRVGFGKLNPQHPHAYPFAERFRVLANYLPGEESLNETGVSLSGRIPAPGDFSLVASGDWLQGDSFRIERESSGAGNDPLLVDADGDRADKPQYAYVGRLAGFAGIGDRSGLEVGVTGTQGTNNVAAESRTTVVGADVKAKLWSSANAYLLLQAEFLHQELEEADWDSTAVSYTKDKITSNGGYVYADYAFKIRYNVGAGYERYQQAIPDGPWDQAVKVYAGFSLMEETTAFRIDWDHFTPGTPEGATESPEAVNTVTLRVIFSMGPHKAHQF
jgi:hypothetical protein